MGSRFAVFYYGFGSGAGIPLKNLCDHVCYCFLGARKQFDNTMMSSTTASNGSSSNGSSANRETQSMPQDRYLYEMPLTERREICLILDRQNVWEDMAYRVGYTKSDVNVSDSFCVSFIVVVVICNL